mmetsp:Transcript_19036/g.44027  ORF Transcript_19036/g.44027 Transcript_19036/m.44027 type:complete len:201 (+) Transcript_19036:206-808(+)|eukprot:CAMPEP_0172393802 /NCGR_PEP_ID=MMETSP1061-20121228/12262_1 /TAXON_ID=37318 /ORGANISM="Pseudo-nitzschia pungens, Strain cf. pungens" /LENGTH=200 /DNA_ID=CAMNT_0013125005 /DNA_START=187 /DNA_END=789 /DNA_ORIENTATION=-
MTNNNRSVVHVVEVDTRKGGTSSYWHGYKETACDATFWKKNIVDNPKVERLGCPVADLCGLRGLAIYVKKSLCQPGFGARWREGGEASVMNAIYENSGLLAENNGAATFLTMQLDTGLTDRLVTGKAYVVCDEGRYRLSRGQVWGIQEMIHCAMDTYDMNPASMRRGEQLIRGWAGKYKTRTWTPPSGLGGIDIYSTKAV